MITNRPVRIIKDPVLRTLYGFRLFEFGVFELKVPESRLGCKL